jgi:hypothetical protein
MKTLILIAASIACYGQTEATFFAISSQVGVTADKLTIQQNQNTPVYAQGVRAVIVSTTAGTCTTEQGGTASTTTAATIRQTNGASQFSRISAFSASNVGTGITTSPVYPLVQVGTSYQLVLDMTASGFVGAGTTKNITVSCSIAAGDIQIALYWRESLV